MKRPRQICAALALAASSCAQGPAPQAARPHVILVVVDTLRMDHTSLDGYERETTPFLNSMVESGATSFTSMRASAPWTKPSVASLFTGLDPRIHGVTQHTDRLHSSHQTLAESYRDAGYQTAGFQTNMLLSSVFGYGQGFETYNEDHLAAHRTSTGAEVNTAVAKWLDESRDPKRPFFLYIHHYEPHFDYLRAGDEWYPDYPGPLTGQETMEQLIGAGDKLRDEELRFLASRYDAEIQYQDELLEELYSSLVSRGLEGQVLFVVTADHGEEFGEHGDISHQYKMFDELLRVPLVIQAGSELGPRVDRVEESLGLGDLGATLLEMSGVEAGFPGQPFVASFGAQASQGSAGAVALGAQLVLAHSIYLDAAGEPRTRDMCVDGEWKLVREEQAAGAAQSPMLFNLARDPLELNNLALAAPGIVERLHAALEIELQRRQREGPGDFEAEILELDADTLRRMADLGYF